jgi:ABC-type arginine transport system ATPase subunit
VLDAGVVTELHDKVYRLLAQGRLVLLGPAGAGKTAAMILLLLAALDFRRSYEQQVSDAQRRGSLAS